jgi:hypothetical protein
MKYNLNYSLKEKVGYKISNYLKIILNIKKMNKPMTKSKQINYKNIIIHRM